MMMVQRYIKIIFFFLILIIIITFFFVFFFQQKKEISYLDTIDSTALVDDIIYAVGRNNANDNKLTKAKFTIYNDKQEKLYEKLYDR